MPLPIDSSFKLLGEDLPADREVSRIFLQERLSEPFQCEVDFSTASHEFRAEQCLNQSLAVHVRDDQGGERYIHGIVTEIELARAVGSRVHFRAMLRPSLWLLSQRMDCRIFQESTAKEIISLLLKEANLDTSTVWDVTTTYPKREFVLQYRESTLNFIQRLLEDEGILYYFRHSKDGHELRFSDSLKADNEESPMKLGLAPTLKDKLSPLVSVSRRKSLRISEMILRDFDVNNPEVPPEGRAPIANPTPQVGFSFGHVPGGPKSAQHYAQASLRSVRASADVVDARARRCSIVLASDVKLDGLEEEQLGGTYFLTETILEGVQFQDGATTEDPDNPIRTCDLRFRAVPTDAVYAPPRRARRPRIYGVQSALVVGDSDGSQSIDVDSLGRIKLHFYWDRLQPADKNASCRVRVNQLPLGGSMILPRVGWEVLVAFENGDPDRPVVLGRTYNAENMPPLGLPHNKAAGSLSSMSSPGGAGSNEISLGDSGGSQGFSIKAQKDLNASTGFDQTEDIAINDEHQVNANLSQSVGIDQTIDVGADQSETFGASLTIKVTGNQTRSVGGNEMANATANLVEKVTAQRQVTISGNQMALSNGERMNVSGNITRKVNVAELDVTAASMSDNITGTYSTTVGAIRAHLVSGSHGEVVAGAKNETVQGGAVHAGSGDLTISAQGASAQLIGAAVQRKVTGDVTIKAPVVTLVGAKGKFTAGGGMMDLAGGPIKLKGGTIVIKAAVAKISSGSLKLG